MKLLQFNQRVFGDIANSHSEIKVNQIFAHWHLISRYASNLIPIRHHFSNYRIVILLADYANNCICFVHELFQKPLCI